MFQTSGDLSIYFHLGYIHSSSCYPGDPVQTTSPPGLTSCCSSFHVEAVLLNYLSWLFSERMWKVYFFSLCTSENSTIKSDYYLVLKIIFNWNFVVMSLSPQVLIFLKILMLFEFWIIHLCCFLLFPTVPESFLIICSGDMFWCGYLFINFPGKFWFRDKHPSALQIFHVLVP